MRNPRVWVFHCRSCGCRVTQLGGRRRRYCDGCLARIAIRMRRQRQGGQFMRRESQLADVGSSHSRTRSFEGGRSLTATADHPLFVLGAGWTPVERDGDDLDAHVSPDHVAALIRILRGHEVADHMPDEPAPDGRSNGRAAR